MQTSRQIALAASILLGAIAGLARAQPAPASATALPATVPLTRLIDDVARETGRRFVLAPGALKIQVA